MRGDRVGILVSKSVEAVTAMLGVTKAGAAYVPMDPSAPLERNGKVLADCGMRAIFVHESAVATLSALEPNHLPRTVIIVGSTRNCALPADQLATYKDILACSDSGGLNYPTASDLAYILYTSGSTGTPKGVTLSHENSLSYIDWCTSILSFSPEDRFCGLAPLQFDISVTDLYVPFSCGASAYFAPPLAIKNPKDLAAFIAAKRIAIWNSTPTALMLLSQFGDLRNHHASSLRMVIFAGEIFPVKHLRELKRHWQSATFLNFYGPTEISVACTMARIPDDIPDDRETPYAIGFPAPHSKTLVLGIDGKEVAPGELGILHISGPSVSPGYWNRPAENASAFLERAGARWYNTGDWVRWDPNEGFHYIGRRDRMAKRRGYRIELDEIERTLYSHRHVREAAVVSVPDDDSGVKIIAFLALAAGIESSLVEFKAYCASKVPLYMSPDRFIFEERLPKTSAGKTDYQALIRLVASLS